MINNQVIKVSKEKYLEKINKENEEFIAKIELGRTVNTNIENMQKIFKGIGNENYSKIECREENFDAIYDFLSDISSVKSDDYQAVEVYIYDYSNVGENFIEVLIDSAKDHEYNVAVYTNNYQKIMSFDIYILDTKISE